MAFDLILGESSVLVSICVRGGLILVHGSRLTERQLVLSLSRVLRGHAERQSRERV